MTDEPQFWRLLYLFEKRLDSLQNENERMKARLDAFEMVLAEKTSAGFVRRPPMEHFDAFGKQPEKPNETGGE